MATKVADAPKRARKTPGEQIPDTPNPLDLAMVAAVSGKQLPDVARRVLEEEARLLHAQCTELRLREIGERVRAALWAILAIVAFALVGLIIFILFKASRSDALVVESFRVPPSMANQGLTGEVLAKQVLDRIAEFQDQTESVRAATSYDNNWGDDLKIDIPQTGASVDQIWKVLRQSLGKETRISGEVIEDKSGLALTTRVGSMPGKRFVGSADNLDALVAKGAEHIMSQTQPYRYAIYLERAGRIPEGLAQLQQLTASPSATERKWAYNGLAAFYRGQGDLHGSIDAAGQALAIDPNMIPAIMTSGADEMELGHDQRAADLIMQDMGIRNDGEYDPRILAANFCIERAYLGGLTLDQGHLRQSLSCLATAPASYRGLIPWVRWQIGYMRHDPAFLAQEPVTVINSAVSAAADNAQARLAMLLVNDQSGPPLATALSDYEAAQSKVSSSSPSLLDRNSNSLNAWPIEARALAQLGRGDEAQVLASKTPLDCYGCLRTRGYVAQARGDRPAAQRWFREAAKQAPKLAPAFVDWGRLLLEAHHYKLAEVKLGYAARMAPTWADPLKFWGDALAGEGKRSEAVAKYDAALKLAPNWQQLKIARARTPGP